MWHCIVVIINRVVVNFVAIDIFFTHPLCKTQVQPFWLILLCQFKIAIILFKSNYLTENSNNVKKGKALFKSNYHKVNIVYQKRCIYMITILENNKVFSLKISFYLFHILSNFSSHESKRKLKCTALFVCIF